MSLQRGGCTHARHGDIHNGPTHTAPHTQPSHKLHTWGSYVIQHTKYSLSLNKCQGWQKITMRRKLHHVHPSTLSKQVVNVGSSTSTIDLLDGALPCNPLRNKFIGPHHTHSPHTSYTNEDHVCNSIHQKQPFTKQWYTLNILHCRVAGNVVFGMRGSCQPYHAKQIHGWAITRFISAMWVDHTMIRQHYNTIQYNYRAVSY